MRLPILIEILAKLRLYYLISLYISIDIKQQRCPLITERLDFKAAQINSFKFYDNNSLSIPKRRQAFSAAFSRIYDVSTPRSSAAFCAVKAIIDEQHL